MDKTQFTSFGASNLVELIAHKGFRMMLLLDDLGAIAQSGRAAGWSPVCRWFDSTLRHTIIMEYSQVVRQRALTPWRVGSNPAIPIYINKRGVTMQKFDDFLDKYLNEQDETFRSEYKKAKEDLEDLLEK